MGVIYSDEKTKRKTSSKRSTKRKTSRKKSTKRKNSVKRKKSNIYRRLDIRFVPYESWSSALLYFTGSKDFNQKMRYHAKQLGYKLNEYGLYKINQDGSETLINTNSEKDIFMELKLKYVTPSKRDLFLQ